MSPNPSFIPKLSVSTIEDFGKHTFSFREDHVAFQYSVPEFESRAVDFLLQMDGNTMYPKYASGYILACRIIRDFQFIQWNKVYIVSTKGQGILVKRLHPGRDEELKMVSENQDYPPFHIPLDQIKGIALVIGAIRLE